jgi:peptidoglycan/xylan/chitin deacetylase (PgdA/CDA1 family)
MTVRPVDSRGTRSSSVDPSTERRAGVFVVSLDFELFWGVRDNRTLDSYRENLEGVWDAVPALLELFERLDIQATWGAVGLLMCDDPDEAQHYAPKERPAYEQDNLSPYEGLAHISPKEYRLHFAPDLVRQILKTPGQELASHSFSHYYCAERGQDLSSFRADLAASIRISQEKFGVRPTSLIFPRNQLNPAYLPACEALGLEAFRGNTPGWLFRPRAERDERLFVRGVRLADHYLPLSGENRIHPSRSAVGGLVNVPASRFLRPFDRKLELLDGLRLRRIMAGLTAAASSGQLYHLWFHPHNFGRDLKENLRFLGSILQHYHRLREAYGMTSLNMQNVGHAVLADRKEAAHAAS